MKNKNLKKIVLVSLLSAISLVLMFMEFSIPIVPSFLKLDISDLPALLAGFSMGPLWGVLICLFKNLLHLPFSSSAFVGELSNFILSSLFVLVSALIYRRRKTRAWAAGSLAAGSAAMAAASFAVNLYVIYPIYYRVLVPHDAILSLYRAILPSVSSMEQAILIFNVPFSFAKCIITAALAFLIYKKVSPVLKV